MWSEIRRMCAWLLCLAMAACREDFDLLAPDQAIWVVYSVLDAEDTVQYVRVQRVFQGEEDAYALAAKQEPGVKGLEITLTGGGQQIRATGVLVPKANEGLFPDSAWVYRFSTSQAQPLQSGTTYELSIRDPGRPGWFLSARSTLPPRPRILWPLPGESDQGEYCLPILTPEDSFSVAFFPNPQNLPAEAYAYEIRFSLAGEAAGKPLVWNYGPTPLFRESQNCFGAGNNSLCYLFRRGEVLRAWLAQQSLSPGPYAWNPEPFCAAEVRALSASVQLQAVALDTALARYMIVNDPRNFRLQTVAVEYSNITGSERAVGIFGSFSSARIPVGISACSAYLLGLSAFRPAGCALAG